MGKGSLKDGRQAHDGAGLEAGVYSVMGLRNHRSLVHLHTHRDSTCHYSHPCYVWASEEPGSNRQKTAFHVYEHVCSGDELEFWGFTQNMNERGKVNGAGGPTPMPGGSSDRPPSER